jgi:hypothetical protein
MISREALAIALMAEIHVPSVRYGPLTSFSPGVVMYQPGPRHTMVARSEMLACSDLVAQADVETLTTMETTAKVTAMARIVCSPCRYEYAPLRFIGMQVLWSSISLCVARSIDGHGQCDGKVAPKAITIALAKGCRNCNTVPPGMFLLAMRRRSRRSSIRNGVKHAADIGRPAEIVATDVAAPHAVPKLFGERRREPFGCLTNCVGENVASHSADGSSRSPKAADCVRRDSIAVPNPRQDRAPAIPNTARRKSAAYALQ